MTAANPLLTRRAVVRAAVEAVSGSPEFLGNNDGVLVGEPMYTIDPTLLERNFTRDALSQLPIIIGRKLAGMEFSTELRGNGKAHSGLLNDAPIITRLFRACGFEIVACPYPTIQGVFQIGDHANEAVFEEDGSDAASAVLTATDQPSNTQTVTIGGLAYTFQDTLTNVARNVKIGASLAATLANLKNAINRDGTGVAGTDFATATTAHPTVSAANNATTLTVTAKTKGAAGNSIAVTDTWGDASWAGGGTLSGGTNIASNTDAIAYILEVTTGGASGAAEIEVMSDTAGQELAPAVVTSGTSIALGTHGLSVEPTFTGNLVEGQRWIVWLLPSGLTLKPRSDGFESITLSMHKDGVKHVMPGSFGTFSLDATAGNYATINWTFTGTYVNPVDEAMPTPVYEKTLPAQVELARLRVDGFYAIVEKFTFDMGNDIQIRPDVSSEEGYIGTRIVGRTPEGGINPEAELVASHDFWGRFAAAQRMPFQMRVGSVQGNTVWNLAPNVQYSGLTYTDRNGILSYDAGLRFAGHGGDDEMIYHFS